jgi:hypothetical protein
MIEEQQDAIEQQWFWGYRRESKRRFRILINGKKPKQAKRSSEMRRELILRVVCPTLAIGCHKMAPKQRLTNARPRLV